jgi:hypothetical protein
METLKLKLFSSFAAAVPEIPALIQEYLDAEEKKEGQRFRLVEDGKSENTGDGMSYYNRLSIFYGDRQSPVFDSGFLLYRPGYAFSTDRPDLYIWAVKLIQEKDDSVVFGYRDGCGRVFINKCQLSSPVCYKLASFNIGERQRIIENQKEPTNVKEFESWAGRQLPDIGGASWHYDAYYEDDLQAVVIARHCSRSVDATHDAFKVFVWKKGQGVAVSRLYETGAKTTYSKFSTNYLRGKVTVDGGGNIVYKAMSEYGDFSVEEIFSIT